MAERAFGTRPLSAVELSGGLYNTTYRVELPGETVILRVAPEPGRQYRIERELMRNEHAALPFLAPIGHLVPRTLFADFTREIAGRDHVWQTLLPGRPAREFPQWTGVYRADPCGARRFGVHRSPCSSRGPLISSSTARYRAADPATAPTSDASRLDSVRSATRSPK
ncbi:phosphotransferase [Amycolatopsis thermophila]|uniref:Aminoglycoside phosphotransferase domain-containing protein n=1 Tax=Amycolatopsis thermophila TaxID=206084 RepID=A0ABU0F3W3_9PSEU|nr:phosphotransferase [Amycolatopsis thermophila]MDQ0381775.1 hypothetical protein [Amycolatopsis thermophila]